MSERRAPIRVSDLRGAARLATDATAGLTDLVEAMHERIARLPGIPAATPPGRTRGITGLVYKTIRGVTHVAGGSVDALLGLLAPALNVENEPMPQREAVIAALNGTLGDHLLATGNPLATPMALRRDGRTLVVERAALAARVVPQATGRVAVLIHGLCMNDLQWQRDGHDHGALLARELGYTPLYLHYNSGLHVSVNGRALAQQLEQLVDQWPQAVERLVLVGHSMGGLLARSAMHYGAQAGHHWLAHLSDVVFIGTPHHGAPLERAGHWIDTVLGATPYAAPLARLGKLRSAGITDLRHGNLVDEDWAGDDRISNGADRRQPLPLPAGVRCHAIASSLGRKMGDLKELVLGDGLVPLDSALGRHRDAARCLAFAPERQWVGQGIGHLDLLKDVGVAAQLQRWLR
ncbi:MAG: GPI inositol-deacylase [Rhizobacter sp.]|nr:GPI inositol-deacylase [Rhizobacter sp.]